MDFLLTYGMYILLGAIAGFLSGLLGIGGGVIVVPGFIYLFEAQGISSNLIMHIAAGTSLASMIVTSSFSMYAHYRRGAVFGAILYIMIPGLIIGTGGGAVLAHFIHSHILKILFGFLVLIISFKQFFSSIFPKSDSTQKKIGYPKIVAGSGGIGLLSGLLGAGGGTLLIPFLEYCGLTMRNAVANSVGCGLVVAVTGTISFILTGYDQINLPTDSIGYIYLPALIGVSIGSPIFTFIGTKLHHYFRVAVLKRIFSVFLIFIGLRLLM